MLQAAGIANSRGRPPRGSVLKVTQLLATVSSSENAPRSAIIMILYDVAALKGVILLYHSVVAAALRGNCSKNCSII